VSLRMFHSFRSFIGERKRERVRKRESLGYELNDLISITPSFIVSPDKSLGALVPVKVQCGQIGASASVRARWAARPRPATKPLPSTGLRRAVPEVCPSSGLRGLLRKAVDQWTWVVGRATISATLGGCYG
jgi:hypothetical protein